LNPDIVIALFVFVVESTIPIAFLLDPRYDKEYFEKNGHLIRRAFNFQALLGMALFFSCPPISLILILTEKLTKQIANILGTVAEMGLILIFASIPLFFAIQIMKRKLRGGAD